MTRTLVVVDTNVVVAGLLTSEPGAPTARLLDAMLAGRLRFLLSIELLAEYRKVLLRPRIAIRHGLAGREIDELLVALAECGVTREVEAVHSDYVLPRGDAHLGRLLAESPGARLVTGDAALASAVGARALSPRELAEELWG